MIITQRQVVIWGLGILIVGNIIFFLMLALNRTGSPLQLPAFQR